MKKQSAKFIIGRKYWSDDKYEICVCNRFDRTNLLRVEVGFGRAANYKIHTDSLGIEWIRAKGRVYKAFP